MPANRTITEQLDKATDAGRNATTEAVRTAQTAARETARAGEQATRAGAETARQGAERARESFESGLTTAARTLESVSDQFTKVLGFEGPQAEELARRSSQNFEAVSQAGTVLAKGVQEISQECLTRSQTRLAKNIEGLNRLVGCRSVQDLIAVQSELLRDNLQLTIENGRRIAELSLRVVNEAAGPIQTQANRSQASATEAGRNTVEVDRTANRARQVA